MVASYPSLNEEGGGLIPGCEISSLLDKNLQGGQLPPMLWRWPVGLLVSYIYIYGCRTSLTISLKSIMNRIEASFDNLKNFQI